MSCGVVPCRGQLEEARSRAFEAEDALERFRQQSVVSHRSTRRTGSKHPAATDRLVGTLFLYVQRTRRGASVCAKQVVFRTTL